MMRRPVAWQDARPQLGSPTLGGTTASLAGTFSLSERGTGFNGHYMTTRIFIALTLSATLLVGGCKTLDTESEGIDPAASGPLGEHTVSAQRAAFAQRTVATTTNPLTARTTLLDQGDPVMVTGYSGNLAEVSLPDGRLGLIDSTLLEQVEPEIEVEDVLVPVLGDDFVAPGFPVTRPSPPPVPVPRSLIEEANELEMPSMEP